MNYSFLIHTGSKNESKLIDHLIDHPEEFDKKFMAVCNWAEQNRTAVLRIVEKYFGKTEIHWTDLKGRNSLRTKCNNYFNHQF